MLRGLASFDREFARHACFFILPVEFLIQLLGYGVVVLFFVSLLCNRGNTCCCNYLG
jgi:hypothetical protein